MNDTTLQRTATVNKRSPATKWATPPVHPAAGTVPMMSDAELAELAQDIAEHGLHEPIVLWRDNAEEANGAKGPFPLYLLDGRNRLAALERLGITDPYNAKQGDLVVTTVRILRAVKQVSFIGAGWKDQWEVDCDPYAFHRSMNVFRRHLTPEQRRWQIKQAIVQDARASDAAIGRKTGTSDKTVASVRAEMGIQNPEIPRNEHLPAERAKAALRANPRASVTDVVKQTGVSRGTVVNARRQLAASPSQVSPSSAAQSFRPRAGEGAGADYVMVHATIADMNRVIDNITPEIVAAVVANDEAWSDIIAEIAIAKALLDQFAARLIEPVWPNNV